MDNADDDFSGAHPKGVPVIISMKWHATRQQIDEVTARIKEFGHKVHSSTRFTPARLRHKPAPCIKHKLGDRTDYPWKYNPSLLFPCQ
jgi:hypothetical protein